ncbi:hypothetical protein [Ruegeria sp. HKCCD8929]|uniref:hypothetical protein n=1 Tax=Ruegeria sp. HKCCD8929 TaxID=2683006 RepID=UPI0014888952|nr:hypothetical protein [Ruegeria sp. HKCCD8929]
MEQNTHTFDSLTLDDTCPVYRRAVFLLNEARHDAKRDQAITYAMRVLSNYAAIGKDAGSGTLKNQNKRVSVAAKALLATVKTTRIWQQHTINEHPLPLKESWDWIVRGAKTLQPTDVWEHFRSDPMITITGGEDRLLSEKGLKSKGGPGRHGSVGIEPVWLVSTPQEIIRSRRAKKAAKPGGR